MVPYVVAFHSGPKTAAVIKKAAKLWKAQFLCMTKMMSCEELLIFFVGHRDRPLHPSITSERMSAKTEARLCPPRAKKVAK